MFTQRKTFGALLAGVLLATQVHAAPVLDETVTIAPKGNLGTGSVFSVIGQAGQTFDLTVRASSEASSWLLLNLFPVIGAPRRLAADYIEAVSVSPGVAPDGGVFETHVYKGIAAGKYSFDVYGAAKATIRLTADATVSAVPEGSSAVYAVLGGLVAFGAVKRRRSAVVQA